MKAAAIVCEYNPFHLGHKKQFDLTRSALGSDTALLCLMSGNFVQRGQPALFDKYVRASAAVRCGADLVLELPLTAAVSSAEGFAAGAVSILDRLGAVAHLSFGCECGDPAALSAVTGCLLSEAFPERLRAHLSTGLSFPAARQRAVEDLCGNGALLREPNNILAVEYVKALTRRSSAIAPLALTRAGSYHGGAWNEQALIDPENPSATALRKRILIGEDYLSFLPKPAAEAFIAAPRYALAFGERAMLARLRTLDDAGWAAVPFGGEGLWRRVRRAVFAEPRLEGVVSASISKRYPETRLRRLLLAAFLGLTEANLGREPPYARVLAFNETGRAILRTAKDYGKIPIINAGEPGPDKAYFALERRASDLYALFCETLDDAKMNGESAGRIYYSRFPGTDGKKI